MIRKIIPLPVLERLWRAQGRYLLYAEKRFVRSFPYRPDDVIIVSYPKSGSGWIRFILSHLIADAPSHENRDIDFLFSQRMVPAISLEAKKSAQADYEALPSPRILRSHSLYFDGFPKVVYLLRDGRDVLVSYYHHYRKFYNFKGSLRDFLASAERPSEWNVHVHSWLYQERSLTDLHVLKYEDMHLDPFIEIKALLAFVGLDREDRQINEAIDASRFDKMRDIEKTKGLGYIDEGNKGIPFIRKGKSGGWRDELGEPEKEIFKKRYGDTLIRAGYERSHDW